MRGFMFACLCGALVFCGRAAPAQNSGRAPVIFDTDIGTDIDDAYALAALIHRPDLELRGVTTVSGDAVARARLAAKLLRAAVGFSSASLHESGGVEFMRSEIHAQPGKLTIIAVGELTNVAALLEAEPGIAGKIRGICLMGGSIYRGYAASSKPEPEWNIKSNAKAAQTVFTSGVPLLVAPLDSTADLKMTPEMRVEVFARGLPLNDALAALNSIWRHTNTWKGENPTLFDVLAVELVAPRTPYPLTGLRVVVANDGLTQAVAGATNARVALKVDAAAFLDGFVRRLRE